MKPRLTCSKYLDLCRICAAVAQITVMRLLGRLTLAATGKGISGALIMDADEQYEQKSASFGGLPDIMDRFAQLASAATGIPMTLLFGMSPGGLNASGDADIRGYYDRVKVVQSLHMSPAMEILDQCLVRSALGDYPSGLHYNWRSLWQPTAKDRADVGNTLMTALERLNNMGVVPMEAIGEAAVNGLTESGAFPGLEAAVAGRYGDDGEDDDLPDVAAIGDAAPRTLYIHRKVVNAGEIIEWAKSQGFKTTLPDDDLHVTIAFSRSPVDWMKAGQAWQGQIELPEGGPRLMDQFGEARVLLFSAVELEWRHNDIKQIGASWDHAEYQPHITISYGTDAPDLASVMPYQGKIVLGPEIFQEVKDDWQEGIKEE
ncbi:MAG: DUF1073 domain-containing protein [Cypionkella sp.]|nr:DUF1073 domain-containing protein [Cypionkella sp.]